MTDIQKKNFLAKVTELLNSLLDDQEIPTTTSTEHPVELLTIKECVQEIRGLNEFTIRQLIARNEIPFVRAGLGKNGKILIPKDALIAYLNGTN